MKENKLEFAPEVIPFLRFGCKMFTIRKGRREFTKNITIHGKSATVNHISYYTLMHIPLEILRSKGYKSMFHCIRELSKYYPDININTLVTVVEFVLDVPEALQGSTRFI